MPRMNISHLVDIPEVNDAKSDVKPIWCLPVSALHESSTDKLSQSAFTKLHTDSSTSNKLAFSLNSLAHPNGNLYFGIGHALYEVPIFVEPKDQIDREDNRPITTPSNAILSNQLNSDGIHSMLNSNGNTNRLSVPQSPFQHLNTCQTTPTVVPDASAPRPRCVCVLQDLDISASTRFVCMFRICWSPDGSIFVLLSHARTEDIRVPVYTSQEDTSNADHFRIDQQEVEENRLFHIFLDGSFYEIDLPNKDINYLAVWGRDAVFVSSTMSWDKNDTTPPLWMLQRTDTVVMGDNLKSKPKWCAKNVKIDMIPESPVYLLVQDTLPDGDILMMVEREMQDDSGRNYTEIYRCHVELESNTSNNLNIQLNCKKTNKNLCVPNDTTSSVGGDDMMWPSSPSCAHTPSSLFEMVSPMHAATPYRYTPRNLSFASKGAPVQVQHGTHTHMRSNALTLGNAFPQSSTPASLGRSQRHRGAPQHACSDANTATFCEKNMQNETDYTVSLQTTKLFGQAYLKKLINSSLPINHIMASQTGCVYCYDLSSAYIDSVWQLGFSEEMTDLVCTRKVAKFHTTDYSYRGRCSASTPAYSGIFSVELSVSGEGERQIVVKKQPLRPMQLTEKSGRACPDMEAMPWKDVELECVGGNVRAHRVVLASRCPYFDTLLTTSLTQVSADGMAKIALPYSIETVRSFVKYLYTQEIQTHSEKMGADLLELVVLADYVCMPELEEKAFGMIFRILTPKTAAHIYVAAKKYTTAAPKVNMIMLHAAHQMIQHLKCVRDTQSDLLDAILNDDIGSGVFRRVLCERHEHTPDMVAHLQTLAKTPGCDFHSNLIDFLIHLRCAECQRETQRN